MGRYDSRHMAAGGPSQPTQRIVPVDAKGVPMAPVPQFIQFQPAAQVLAGATGLVTYTVDVRDFICTHVGYTSQGVGFPALGMVFNLQITDVGASRTFQPFFWNTTAALGTNPATSDHGPLELPVPWRFAAKTTVRVEFQNTGALACTPTVVLIGYLDKMG